MTEARRDPGPGRIVVAGHQTAGMGRFGRAWHSPAGGGLYASFVIPAPTVPVVTLALGLATCEAIGAGDLRWPNDVLLNGRKCAGILTQTEGASIIAGIGINVRQTEFPPGLDTPATSLALEGIEISREDLLLSLARAIDRTSTLPGDEIVRRFTEASSYARGRRVRAGEIEGVTTGLDAAGFLRVRDDSGVEHTILSGGVRPA